MSDHLRRFYDIALACERPMPSWEHWEPAMRQYIAEGKADLWPIARGGVMIGGAMFAGDTVHLVVLPEWHGRWMTPAMRRAYDTWTHEVPIRGLIQPDNSKTIELATRLGFIFQREQGPYHVYIKEPTHA